MRNIVELRNDSMQQLRSSETVLSLDLRSKVTQDDHSWLIRSDQDGSDEEFEVIEPLRIAAGLALSHQPNKVQAGNQIPTSDLRRRIPE